MTQENGPKHVATKEGKGKKGREANGGEGPGEWGGSQGPTSSHTAIVFFVSYCVGFGSYCVGAAWVGNTGVMLWTNMTPTDQSSCSHSATDTKKSTTSAAR